MSQISAARQSVAVAAASPSSCSIRANTLQQKEELAVLPHSFRVANTESKELHHQSPQGYHNTFKQEPVVDQSVCDQ